MHRGPLGLQLAGPRRQGRHPDAACAQRHAGDLRVRHRVRGAAANHKQKETMDLGADQPPCRTFDKRSLPGPAASSDVTVSPGPCLSFRGAAFEDGRQPPLVPAGAQGPPHHPQTVLPPGSPPVCPLRTRGLVPTEKSFQKTQIPVRRGGLCVSPDSARGRQAWTRRTRAALFTRLVWEGLLRRPSKPGDRAAFSGGPVNRGS